MPMSTKLAWMREWARSLVHHHRNRRNQEQLDLPTTAMLHGRPSPTPSPTCVAPPESVAFTPAAATTPVSPAAPSISRLLISSAAAASKTTPLQIHKRLFQGMTATSRPNNAQQFLLSFPQLQELFSMHTCKQCGAQTQLFATNDCSDTSVKVICPNCEEELVATPRRATKTVKHHRTWGKSTLRWCMRLSSPLQSSTATPHSCTREWMLITLQWWKKVVMTSTNTT